MDLLFLFFALRRISFATTIAIHYSGPIIVSVLAPPILGERFSPRGLLFAIIGAIAVFGLCKVALHGPNDSQAWYGIIFAIASAFTLAGNIIFQRLYMTQQSSFGNAVFQYNLYMAIGYLLLVFMWPATGHDINFSLKGAMTQQLILGFVAGLLTQGLAMILFNSAIRYLDSQTVSRMAFLEVVFTILLGALIYNETVSPMQISSIAVIVVVVYLSQRESRHELR